MLTACLSSGCDVQAESYLIPDAVNTAGAHGHDMYNFLTVLGQYKAAAPLVRHLLHPEVTASYREASFSSNNLFVTPMKGDLLLKF